ncbi:MAG: hypothetical protein FD146_1842 [Anaerolineaceae bacterium]|nr:MAG: hypothetical protein FD146_1842 [Anaerolineaceae bacterium]
MINNDRSHQTSNQQSLYTAEESNWQDLNRITTFVIILGTGFVIATIYLAFFLFYLSNKLPPANQSAFTEIMTLIAGFLVVISPLALEFAGLRIVSGIARKFTKTFYALVDESEVAHLVKRRVFGVPPVPRFLAMTITYPFIVVDKDRLDSKFSWAYSLGGPAKLIVYDGYAVYLERGGKFSRVVGSGIAFLERYETVRDIIDLRPQIKEIEVEAWTKDGIKLNMHIRLECQLLAAKDAEKSQNTKDTQETEKRVYPFYEPAVQKAVETAAVRLGKDGQLEKYDWLAGIVGNIEGHIRTHVYSNTINDLLRGETIYQTQPEMVKQQFQGADLERLTMQLLSAELRDLIRERVNKDIERLGSQLISLQIVRVDKSLAIDRQWTENWSAEWKSRNVITEGEAKAYRIRTQEKARAEAQRDMIRAITESLEKVDAQHMREPLLLSLSGMLENSLVDTYVRASLPKEAMETLEKLQNFLQDKK